MNWGLALLWFGSGVIAGGLVLTRMLRALLNRVTIVSASVSTTKKGDEEVWRERLWFDYSHPFFTSACAFDMSPELMERMRTMRDIERLPPNEKREIAQMVGRWRTSQEIAKEAALKELQASQENREPG